VGALQREAMSAGARFGQGAWREAMSWRFGDGEPAASAAPEVAPEPIDILADFDIPDNGRDRSRPRRTWTHELTGEIGRLT